jgi:hypothetical protein
MDDPEVLNLLNKLASCERLVEICRNTMERAAADVIEHKEALKFFKQVEVIQVGQDFFTVISNPYTMEAGFQLLVMNSSQTIVLSINPQLFKIKPPDEKLIPDFALLLKCSSMNLMREYNRVEMNNALSAEEMKYYFENIRRRLRDKIKSIRNTMFMNFGLDGTYDLNEKQTPKKAVVLKSTEEVLSEQKDKLAKAIEKAKTPDSEVFIIRLSTYLLFIILILY